MKYAIANWKMNMSLADLKKWYSAFTKFDFSNTPDDLSIILAPSSLHVSIATEIFKNSIPNLNILIASQDVSEFELGAHTGYTGAFQLKDFCKYSIIGHSERKEPTEKVLLKRDLCLQNNIVPIICFAKPEDAIKMYIPKGIMVWEDPSNISVDGKYRAKDPTEIAQVIAKISETLPSGTEIVYGGSVNRQNVQSLVNIDKLNGVLVGNASLDPNHFFDIVQAFSKLQQQ